MYDNERCLIFDESGNLGVSGRYFVISCIDTMNAKSLHNVMKRKLKQAGNKFPELKTLHAHEIKAKDAYPCVKYHILESILSSPWLLKVYTSASKALSYKLSISALGSIPTLQINFFMRIIRCRLRRNLRLLPRANLRGKANEAPSFGFSAFGKILELRSTILYGSSHESNANTAQPTDAIPISNPNTYRIIYSSKKR